MALQQPLLLLWQDEKAEGFVSLPEFKIDRATECRRKLWVLSFICSAGINFPASADKAEIYTLHFKTKIMFT